MHGTSVSADEGIYAADTSWFIWPLRRTYNGQEINQFADCSATPVAVETIIHFWPQISNV